MLDTLSEEDRDFLQHYGVKGMKWGVRRSQAQLDQAAGRPPTKRQQRRASNEAKVARNKGVRDLGSRKRSATVRNVATGIGKIAVTRYVGKRASNLVGNITRSPKAQLGASIATDIMQVKVLVNTIQNQRDINRVQK